ncbi:MAG: CoA transferase [Roseiflexus sp.]|nr:CoA transferase [Roseiflexus sp.]MCS7289606.1 CoA transferase [Roseiflexus sp.]MDW8146376.1 CaiB/BaiF CoA-transferase family protein [Roseiflexaceae bacterium]MDW8233208.1 CaiB/BaiF CoA-transferase family protein [Roseiflexaceae bacterium]
MTSQRPPRPLDDIRVLELGAFLAGPFCGQLLADFGAEVIKVEPPGKGDPMREWGRHRYRGRALWWPVLARNKKSVTIDLRTAEGQALVKRLVPHVDMVLENFRPGTLEAWGLGWEELRALNPALIMIRVSGFGQTGPYRDKAGFGSIGEAMGGIRAITGFPDRPPSRIGISIGDSLAATFAALGALVALHQRQRSGQGQIVDIGIYEGVLALMESMIPEFQLTGHIRERTGTILPNVAPSNIYPTADGSWLVIGANADTVFARLAQAMGQPELAHDPRFATHQARGDHQTELDDLIAAWTINYTADQLQAIMDEYGVPASRIYTAKEMLSDPHFIARQSIIGVQDPELGEIKMQNVVPRLSATPGGIDWTGPALGQHNREIFAGLLGLSEEEIAVLQAKRVI